MEKDSSKEGEGSKPRKAKQTYKIRDVIKQLYRERIEEEIPVKTTDKEFIGHYQRAVTTIHENLTTEELNEAEAKLDLWNKEGLPSNLRLK
jgi:hypothetical protein